MNALADKAPKQGISHSDMHSITWPHYSTINHPYISSSGMPVGTKFTANYVGMHAWLLNNVAILWSAYHFLVCVVVLSVLKLL